MSERTMIQMDSDPMSETIYGYLEVAQGTLAGTRIELRQPTFIIGRRPSPEVQYRFDFPFISGKHCTFEYRNGAVTLTDNQSTNGTFLNGQPLEAYRPYPLTNGANIRLGKNPQESIHLRFQLANAGGMGQAPIPFPTPPAPMAIVPQNNPHQQGGYQQYNNPYGAPAYNPNATNPDTVLLVEILGGFFGFLGIGHIMAGNTVMGIVALFGYWMYLVVTIVMSILTAGLCGCVMGPAALGIIIFSAIQAREYARKKAMGMIL